MQPTKMQFDAINGAYQYFNEKLFGGQLNGCLLNFSRKAHNVMGFMSPDRWRSSDKSSTVHEISINPRSLYRTPQDVYSTLVHEMAHIWQWDFGKPSRNGYHNKEWADKMIEIGLMPSHTGLPGGNMTGQQMTHYVIEDGPFDKAMKEMPDTMHLPFIDIEADMIDSEIRGKEWEAPKAPDGSSISNPDGSPIGNPESAKAIRKARLRPKSRAKTKYTCPCGNNVWGKPGLHIGCGVCEDMYQEVD